MGGYSVFMDLFSYPDRLHQFVPARKWKFLTFLMAMVDILTIALAFQIGFFLNYKGVSGLFMRVPDLLIIFLAGLPLVFFLLFLIKSTGIPVKHLRKLIILYVNSALICFVLIVFLQFLTKMTGIPRLFIIELPFICFALLLIIRILKQNILFLGGARDYKYINIVIVADDSSLPVIDDFMLKHKSRYKTEVIFTESQAVRSKYERSAIILPEKYSGILDDLIDVNMIDEILYLKSRPDPEGFRKILRSCEENGLTLRLIRLEDEKSLSSGFTTSIQNKKFLSFVNLPNNSMSLSIKKTADQVLATWLIVGLLPIFALLCLILPLLNTGPLFITHERTGLRGHHFQLFRFATGICEIEEKDDEEYKKFAERIQSEKLRHAGVTRSHRFLYRSGLDRLPTLLNVLKGDISLLISGRRISVKNLHIN